MSTLKTNNIQHVDLADPSILLNSDGSVSIAGTVSYEDSTNVDSVGIITGRVLVNAQKQVHVGTGVSVKSGGLNVTAGITTVQALQATTGTFTGDVSIPDTIVHTGDTNTKIRFPANDQISFETNGSEGFRLNSEGKLLIGQTNDNDGQICMAGVLQFNSGGSGTAGGANVRPNISRIADGGLLLAAGKDTDSTIRFDVAANASTNAAEVMRISPNGTVGIATISPAGKLDVHGSGSTAIIKARRLDGNGGYNLFEGYSDVNAASTFYVSQNGLGFFNQRVNIGTSDAGYGDADDLNIATSAHTGMTIRSGTSSLGTIAFSDGTSGQAEYKGFVQYNHSQDTLHLGSAHQSKATINADGNTNFVGIVTATEIVATNVQTSGRKNLIINGGHDIAQRGTAAVTATTSAGYRSVDRYKTDIDGSGGGDFSHAQSTDVPTGQGFRHSSKFTTVTQASQPTSESNHHQVYQMLEKQDVYHLEWGTSNAKTCTLSFWVKGSITGTYGFWFAFYGGSNYYYWTNYTINSANTWEKKTITVTGPTSGGNVTADSSTNGFRVEWVLGVGSDAETGTLNAWTTSGTFRAASGTVYLPENAGATFYLTGVQFEVGSNASAFEFRSFSEELLLCKRYFDKVGAGYITAARGASSSMYLYSYSPPVIMRASPTVATNDALAHGTFSVRRYRDSAGVSDSTTTPATNSNYFQNNASVIYLQQDGFTAVDDRSATIFISGGAITLDAEL